MNITGQKQIDAFAKESQIQWRTKKRHKKSSENSSRNNRWAKTTSYDASMEETEQRRRHGDDFYNGKRTKKEHMKAGKQTRTQIKEDGWQQNEKIRLM